MLKKPFLMMVCFFTDETRVLISSDGIVRILPRTVLKFLSVILILINYEEKRISFQIINFQQINAPVHKSKIVDICLHD